MELAATLLALTIGVISLILYYTKKNGSFLFIGVGFLGTAFLDGYHAVVTSTFFSSYLDLDMPSLIPWSWSASRTYLSILMVVSWWAWKIDSKVVSDALNSTHHPKPTHYPEKYVYLIVTAFTLFCFAFFVFSPLPRAYYPELFFGRPQEFIAAALFGIALFGYLQKQEWRRDQFESWIVISLIVAIVSQALVMPRSFTLFDSMFDLAHILKIFSYACVLVGLLINMHTLFSQAQKASTDQAKINELLRYEVEANYAAQEKLTVALKTTEQDALEMRNLNEESLELIEELSKEKEQTKQAEDYLKAVIGSIPSGIILVDQERNILLVNSETERIFEYSQTELIGQPIEMVVPFQIREEHVHMFASFIADPSVRGIGVDRDLKGVRKDGTNVPVEVSLSPVMTKAGLQVVSIINDITNRKLSETKLHEHAQKLKETNLELEQFAYVASHDLQEPLRKVTSFCQLLADEFEQDISEDAKTYIEFIVDGAKRMSVLISDLLTYSRTGETSQPLEIIDSLQCYNSAIENLQTAIEESEAVVTCGNLPSVCANKVLLTQLLQNLIGNAIKYRGENKPAIHVNAELENQEWTFQVQDNGIGIAVKYRDRIFKIFQRLHSRDEYSGTGIGLAICKKIVSRFNGRIWVDQNIDNGCTFRFTVPQNGVTNDG
ncbi:MAG: hypothetical protein COA78_10385 [Blastopirellula sp.]|nr:MAG: hypothetical protein COA78_10385 [Blastopirellula sp.]